MNLIFYLYFVLSTYSKLPKQFRETKRLIFHNVFSCHRAVKLRHPFEASVVFLPIFLPKLYIVICRKEQIVNGKWKCCYRWSLVTNKSINSCLLLRRLDSATNNLLLEGLPSNSNRSHAEPLATLAEDSRVTSTDTLRRNIGMLDRCISANEVKRRAGRSDRSVLENCANHSIYSTWL